MKKSFAQKAREAGVKEGTAYARRAKGWTDAQALGKAPPPGKKKPAKKPDNPKVSGVPARNYDDLVKDDNRSGAAAAIILTLAILLVIGLFVLEN
jgi:hypothetical protein